MPPKGRKNLRDKLWGNPKVFRNVQSAAKLIIRKENKMRPFYYSTHSPIWNKPFIYEEWRRIDDTIYPNADGPLWVSNTGKFYDERTNSIIEPSVRCFNNINRKESYVNIKVAIPGKNIKYVSVSCHVLVMRAFYPTDDPNLEINHINGDSTKNDLFNLAWCTNAENIKFAYMNGQMTYTDKDGNVMVKSILMPEEVDKVCELIREGKTYGEISRLTGVRYQTILSIHQGRTYKEYYEKYNLKDIPIPKEPTMDDETIFNIADLLMEGNSSRKVANMVGCSTSTVQGIRDGYLFKDKLKDYDFESLRTKSRKDYLTDEQKILVRQFVRDNKDKYRYPGPLHRDALRSIGYETSDRLFPALRHYMEKLCSDI